MAKIRDANTLMSLLAGGELPRDPTEEIDLGIVAETTELPTFEANPEAGA